MQRRGVIIAAVLGTLLLLTLVALAFFVARRIRQSRRKRGVLGDAEDTDDYNGVR